MHKRHTKFEFTTLFMFLLAGTLLLSNGFISRIFAQSTDVDVFEKIKPIGDVMNTVLDEYVTEPDMDKVVEGALVGMLNSLDKHSSFLSAEMLRSLREETKGEFFGIGVSIQLDDSKNVTVNPIPDSPAAKAGVQKNDIIIKIDDVEVSQFAENEDYKKLDEVKNRIRGPEGSIVKVTMLRRHDKKDPEMLDFEIKRGNIPLESVKESRLLSNGIGYIRISDFKDTTARDLAKNLNELKASGMTSLVLDLRWNVGGLLSASSEVCELFLPKNTLVTYTKGRNTGHNNTTENLKLYTEKNPILPQDLPIVILTNEDTASSAEIVTGAMQFWQRALVIGQKTYGKGSVQTVIPLARPAGSALRLTTALYYTPAEVTINGEGIKPDVEVLMAREQQLALFKQMYSSLEEVPLGIGKYNHGSATGDAVSEGTVEDIQLQKALDILKEDPSFKNLITKYHKDTHETQVAASSDPLGKTQQSADANAPEAQTQSEEPAVAE